MSRVTFTPAMADRLTELLGLFRVPTMAAETVKRFEQAGHHEALHTLLEVAELEANDRRQRRIERLQRASRLPTGKTSRTFDEHRLPKALAGKMAELMSGAFLDRATNVLAFGLPGTGKTHLACALGHALVQDGRSVLFTPTYELVQTLLAAKRDLVLSKALRKLDTFELLILDDIGYVQQDSNEAEVLFTLIAERYERKSLFITSNLVFGEWERIFKNPMATAAAVDRLVHHSIILEFNVPSYRTEQAAKRKDGPSSKKPQGPTPPEART
jgi:DNA replication protein DnaC